MKLFVNGCSHTDGTDWSIPKSQTWPSRSHHDVVDLSRAGCSNNRIVRSSIETILNPKFIDIDYAFIQFTDPTRFEVPQSINLGGCRDGSEEFKQIIPQAHTKGRLVNRDSRFCRDHFSLPEQKSMADTILLTHIISLQSFLINMDIPYCFMIWWPPRSNNFWKDSSIQRMWKAIDHTRIINADDNFIWGMDKAMDGRGFRRSKTIRYDGIPDNHFMIDGHKWIGRRVEQFISTGKKISHINTRVQESPEVIYRYG